MVVSWYVWHQTKKNRRVLVLCHVMSHAVMLCRVTHLLTMLSGETNIRVINIKRLQLEKGKDLPH